MNFETSRQFQYFSRVSNARCLYNCKSFFHEYLEKSNKKSNKMSNIKTLKI